jgi:hypothetical protein
MLSAKQAGHYAFPSCAFYALALALWCAPAMVSLLTAKTAELQISSLDMTSLSPTHRNLRWLAVGMTGALIVATGLLAGQPHRDRDIYHDTVILGQRVPRFSAVGIGPDLANDYALMAYLSRWDDIHADSGPGDHEYRLAINGAPPAGYTLVDAGLQRYKLFARETVSDGSEQLHSAVSERPVVGASPR